jgi:hypothetical protein
MTVLDAKVLETDPNGLTKLRLVLESDPRYRRAVQTPEIPRPLTFDVLVEIDEVRLRPSVQPAIAFG